MIEHVSGSVEGYTREQLAAMGIAPVWLPEAEEKFGLLQRHCALQLPDGREIHLSKFVRGWRWTLHNPANDPPHHEVDIWLTLEGMEASLMLTLICKEALGETVTDEAVYQHLLACIDQGRPRKDGEVRP